MFISKFWTLLLAFFLGVLLSVVLLGKDVVNRERKENAKALIYKEMTKVEVALKLHARNRLDVLLSIAADPSIRAMFDAASSSQDKTVKTRGDLLGALRKQNKELDLYAADLLIALDVKGEVICQVGRNESDYGYNLAGFPAVAAALRGYLRDDVWKINNELFLVAVRPVIEQGRYVGALVHAMKVTDKLLSTLSPSVQLAFFTGNVITATRAAQSAEVRRAPDANIGSLLDAVLSSDKYNKEGYSEVQSISTPEADFVAVYARVRGEAAANQAGFALVIPVEKMASWTELYSKAATQDIQALPLVPIIGIIVAIALLGGLFNYLEGQRPYARLLKSVGALEKADPKDQLNIYEFRRKTRKLAVAINSLVDFKIRSTLETKGTTSKNIDSILGKTDAGARLSTASFKFVEPSASEVPPPPPPPPAPIEKPAEKPAEKPPEKPAEKPVEKRDSLKTTLSGGAPREGSVSPRRPNSGPPAPVGKSDPVTPVPEPVASPVQTGPDLKPLSQAEEQKYFREIYEEFVKIKKSLGEPTDQLTFERFLGTLKKNRDTLIARYGCKQVKFEVYAKDGKASLKAIPVK